jgi:putative drug exporter of the RND superfamily
MTNDERAKESSMQRLARWSIERRRRVVAAWCVLLVVSIALAGTLKNHFDNNLTLPGTGAQHAADLLHSRFRARAGDTDQIVFRIAGGTLRGSSARARVTRALAAVGQLPHVSAVASPYTSAHAIARDGTIGFATVTFDERADALPTNAVKKVINVAQQARSPSLQVALGGGAIEESQRPTLGAATAIGILAAMVVLFLSFGSLLAMALPIVTALFGLGTSMGLIAVLTHAVPTPDFASELALLIGLGVGIDYALFVVTRYRDRYYENGGDTTDAVEVAMNTAGRSITFAGATVVIAVLGLFVTGVHIFYGVALAVALTVILVLAASLTLLPAALSFAGRRIGARRRPRAAGGLSAAWFGAILRRPALAAVAATALLLLLAAPALGLRLAASDASNDTASTTTHQAYELLSKGFGPGFNAPLQLAVQLPAKSRAQTLARLGRVVAGAPGVASVSVPEINAAGDTADLTAYPSSAPESRRTYALVKHLRTAVLPPVERATGATVSVGGYTASQVDFAHVLARKLPLFIGAVILLSALLLLVVFRSLLIPLQAAAMNLLSIGAALGVAQAVFERGWGAGLLGVTRSPIEAFIPVIVFAIVFGLSMDYEVFLVSRIHEEWTHGAEHTDAIRAGLRRTSRVITAAAAVMILVFASFAASNNHLLKLFGLALAVSVFLDAIVIRSILLPAVLQLLGRATWRFPAWADRLLPRLAIEAPEQPTPETAPALELT